MAILDHSTYEIAAGIRAGVFGRVANSVRVLLCAMRNRRTAVRLSELSDWELADIGLTRDDVRAAFRNRMTVDPTPELEILARSRRSLEDAARRIA